jgi:hypothetical protein
MLKGYERDECNRQVFGVKQFGEECRQVKIEMMWWELEEDANCRAFQDELYLCYAMCD